MRPAKLLAVFLSAAVFSGCATLMGQSDVEYQNNHSVEVGQVVAQEKGLYHLAFPHEHYYLERTAYRLMFVPKDTWNHVLGPYIVKVFPKTYLAKGYAEDLGKTFDLLVRKEVGRKAFRKIVMLKQEERDFRGEKALYKEFFIPERTAKNFEGDPVKFPPSGYAGLLFMHEGNVYWVAHGEPIEELLKEEKKTEPRVEKETVDRMQAFLDSIVFGPSKK